MQRCLSQWLLSQGPLIYVMYLLTYISSLNCLNPCGVQCSGAIFGARVFPV